MKRKSRKNRKSPRKHAVTFLLNDQEWNALLQYQKRYNIHNRSNLIRHTLMRALVNKLNEDQLTLF